MKPKQNKLTDAELLILLEGDVSDVDLDMSGDEFDLVSDRNKHAVLTSPVALGLDPEMTEVRVREEEDLDDMPLSLRLQSLLVGMQKYKLSRRHHTVDQDVTFAGV